MILYKLAKERRKICLKRDGAKNTYNWFMHNIQKIMSGVVSRTNLLGLIDESDYDSSKIIILMREENIKDNTMIEDMRVKMKQAEMRYQRFCVERDEV